MSQSTSPARWTVMVLLAAGIFRFGAAPRADAQCPPLLTLQKPNPAASDSFGEAAAIWGDHVVLGSSGDDTGAAEAGAAYLFDIHTGALLRAFNNPEPESGARFGHSVAIHENRVLVGAYMKDNTSGPDGGRAYLFDATTGLLLQTFDHPSANANNFFGASVALTGSHIVVGADLDRWPGQAVLGGVYIFDAATSELLNVLSNPTPEGGNNRFGVPVAISGNTVVVAARYDDAGAADSGVAHLFDAASGLLLRTLGNPTPQAGDLFGGAVAISGNNVVVGAPYDNTGASHAGSAYLFDAASGSLLRTFNMPSPQASGHFGISAAIQGSNVLVGSEVGKAYLFDAGTGSLLQMFGDPSPNDLQRYAAMSESGMVVGAPQNDAQASDAGAAFVYAFVSCTPSPSATPSPSPTPSPSLTPGDSPTPSPSLTASPSPSVSPTPSPSPGACAGRPVTQKNPSPADGFGFGGAVAISENYIVAADRVNNNLNAETVYLFDAATGSLLRAFKNPGFPGNYFGSEVAISGNRVLVGSFLGERVFLYDAATGALLTTAYNPSWDDEDYFGESLAISEDYVVVGAPGDDTQGNDAGMAYVYNASASYLIRPLRNPSPQSSDAFGSFVGISGTTIIVGAPGDDAAGINAGAVYLFDAVGGARISTFNNPDPAHITSFGSIVVPPGGNPLAVGYGPAGTVRLYDATTGGLVQTFLDPTPTTGDDMSGPVEIWGNHVLIGDIRETSQQTEDGMFYLFDLATGGLVRSYKSPSPTYHGHYGARLGIWGENIIAGDIRENGWGWAYLLDAGTGSQKMRLPAAWAGQKFGESLAIWDATALVGAPHDPMGSTSEAGMAYLFDARAGEFPRALANPSPAAGDQFGASVAIAEGKALVGAPYNDDGAANAGSAYLFDAATGTLLRTFVEPTPAANDQFGHAVAISGKNVVIGAPNRDAATSAGAKTNDAGSAYLFDAGTGSLLQTLQNPVMNESDHFGSAVAVSGDRVLIGAYADNTGALNTGRAYLFDAATGALLRAFNNPEPANDDWFGYSVAISGNGVLIGTPYDGEDHRGSAYLFDAATGSLRWTFNNPSPNLYDDFGWSVAISGSNALVGTPLQGAKDTGRAYLFDAGNGALLQVFENPAPVDYDDFGWSAGISGNNIILGAPQHGDPSRVWAGAAYVYTCPQTSFSRIRSALLGWREAAPEDDLNADGVVDLADLALAGFP